MKLFFKLILFTIIINFSTCRSQGTDDNKLFPMDGYPKWLKDNHVQTDQTSGIAFIGEDEFKTKHFISVDDIGVFSKLAIIGDKIKIQLVPFSCSVKQFFQNFPKLDFEEIAYDRDEDKFYLSVEGNDPTFQKYLGIYQVEFFRNGFNYDSVQTIKKIEFPDWNIISKYASNNIGFEGITVSNNTIFLGLEGFQNQNLFLDSTLICIINKKDLKLKKIISTKNLGIYTICGLFAVDDYKIFGIDRNRSKIFQLNFNVDYSISDYKIISIATHVPGNSKLFYSAALESITIDNQGFFYLIDDPWKKYYIPEKAVLDKLSEFDRNNFKEFVPLIYKYKITE